MCMLTFRISNTDSDVNFLYCFYTLKTHCICMRDGDHDGEEDWRGNAEDAGRPLHADVKWEQNIPHHVLE